MLKVLALSEIKSWLLFHKQRIRCRDTLISMSEIATKAGISRQTLYAVLNDERREFGEIAQIRLSRVIKQISSEPSYQHSKIAKIDFTGATPRIRFGM